ncbi:mitogen-activated protein kinase kinase kinase [Balamuthia mandrillaris]
MSADNETRRQVMEETWWRVALSNSGKSSSLQTGCYWSLPASQSTSELTLPAECWLSSTIDNSTGATVKCLMDLAPHSSEVFTLALPSWSSILCLDESGNIHYQLHAEEQARAEDDSDSNAVGLGVGLGVGLFCLLLLVMIAIVAVVGYRKKRASSRDAIADVESGAVEYTVKRDPSKKSGKKDKDLKFSWEIPFDELEFGDELGRGDWYRAFGIVWKGSWRESPVAIKQVLGITTGAELEDFKSEIQIMK